MTWSVFAELIELKAKAASVFPFLLGLLYSWYKYQHVEPVRLLVFFLAMLFFNMAVDILDNYMDYMNAASSHDYRDKTNIIGREQLSLALVHGLMIGFTLLAAGLGLLLVYQTSLVVLGLGVLSFGVGIFYSAGPKPISHTPFGEIASGLTMGYVIPLICIYLNICGHLVITQDFFMGAFWMTGPVVCTIANVMLANNTCDLEEDLINNRKTLVAYIGTGRAVLLFRFLAILSFIWSTIASIFHVVPMTILLMWLVFPKVWHHVRLYTQEQGKQTTFPLAIKNLILVAAAYSVLFFIGVLLDF